MNDETNKSRRDFLMKAGKLAAYTPPTMLALMYPGAHAIASGGANGPVEECDKEGGRAKGGHASGAYSRSGSHSRSGVRGGTSSSNFTHRTENFGPKKKSWWGVIK